MKISFDPAKDANNMRKHGVHLAEAEAEALDWDAALVKPDSRHDYGEARQIGYVPMGSRLYCVVFVERTDELRIISRRKANSREVNRYVQETEADSPDA